MELTAERLREVLDYDAVTGTFTWRMKIARKVMVGSRAGSTGSVYAEVGILGKSYRLHRLAWLYVTGEWPSGEIDHIDQNKRNNAFSNLRDVGRSENLINQSQPLKTKRTSTYRGVFPSSGGRWFSRLKRHGKIQHLGTFDSEQEAHAAYLSAKSQEMESWNGEAV